MTATLVKSLSVLPLGRLRLDQSILTYREGVGVPVEVPVTAAFIEMQNGEHILFDTGIDPSAASDTGVLPEHLGNLIARHGREDDIRHHLAQLGYRPEDISMVANSHLHWDHCGANHMFKSARFISQDREVRFAGHPDPFVARPYLASQYDWIETMEILHGDTVLYPGVALMTTPGHTPGHQSMLVRLPSGSLVILTGDAVFCPANYDAARPPGNAHTPSDATQSIQRVRMLGEFLQARTLICHDPDIWANWKPCPHRYH